MKKINAKKISADNQPQSSQNRLEILAEDNTLVIQKDSPVVIEKTVLFLDKTTNTVILRCNLRCISNKPLKAVSVDIKCFDVWGNEVTGIENFQFLDLKTNYDFAFGQTTPIYLPDNSARSSNLYIQCCFMTAQFLSAAI